MFKVITRNFNQSFDRWTDALETGKSLIPQCKSWFQDIRIFEGDELIWIYSRSHTYPQYIGAGNYRRLALLFMQEAIAEQEAAESAIESSASDDAAPPSSESTFESTS